MSDSTTHLDTISQSQAQKEVTANALFDAASPGMVFGRRASTSVGLTWGYYGGVITPGGIPTDIANGTVALTGSTTNYVYVADTGSPSTWVVTVTTSIPSGWPGPLLNNSVALYEVVTSATAATSWEDKRGWWGAAATGGGGGGTPTGTGFRYVASGVEAGAALTATEATALLDQFLGDSGSPTTPTKGLVPAPTVGDGTTKFLRSDGTWAEAGTGDDFIGDVGSPTTPASGLVPAPAEGDGSTKFLKADGTWAVPPGGTVTKIMMSCSDLTTALTPGTNKAVFRMPYAMTLTSVRASLATADTGSPVSGITIDINENGSTILSTKLTIDGGEKTSTAAATPAVISDTALADDAEITVDIDAVGGNATGLIVTLIGTTVNPEIKTVQFACSDLTTALTPGTNKAVFRMPHAMTVTAVRASLATADTGSPVSGVTVDINEGGVSILSTKLTIDGGEKTSTTAATPAVISDTALADDAEITVDIDAVGGNATGLVVAILGL